MSVPDGFVEVFIPEIVVAGKRLGRHVAHDPRSKGFPAELAPLIKTVKHAGHGLPLNQGDLGDCTTNALCACLNCSPNWQVTPPRQVAHEWPMTETDAVTAYERETANEGQPYPPNDPGGTGLFACKAGHQLGWIDRYAHTFSLEAMLRSLVLRPGMMGSLWYDSMDQPDINGVVSISPNAVVRGGHEYCAAGIDAVARLVWFWQSWGEWGLDGSGQFAMTWDTIAQLLSEQGDYTVPNAAVAR